MTTPNEQSNASTSACSSTERALPNWACGRGTRTGKRWHAARASTIQADKIQAHLGGSPGTSARGATQRRWRRNGGARLQKRIGAGNYQPLGLQLELRAMHPRSWEIRGIHRIRKAVHRILRRANFARHRDHSLRDCATSKINIEFRN